MNGIMKRIIVLLIALSLVMVPCVSCLAQELQQDDDIKAGMMTGDALIVRPLGLAATIIGGTVFVISLPFSALGGNAGPAYNHLLADPFKFTFSRPLGDF